MITTLHENARCITSILSGEATGPRGIPLTRAESFDVLFFISKYCSLHYIAVDILDNFSLSIFHTLT